MKLLLLRVVQDPGDGAGGRQERRAGPTPEVPPEPAGRHPAGSAPERGNRDNGTTSHPQLTVDVGPNVGRFMFQVYLNQEDQRWLNSEHR